MAFFPSNTNNNPAPDYKANDYQLFDQYGQRGKEAIDSLGSFGKDALLGSPDFLDRIMSKYSRNPTTQAEIDRTLVKNRNVASAGGINGSNMANFNDASAIAQIDDAGRNQFLNNNLQLMGMGQNALTNNSQLGFNATQSSLGGLQNDERLAFEKQQYEDKKRAEEDAKSGGWAKGLAGIATKLGMNAIIPGLGTVASGWVNDKLGLKTDLGGGLVKKNDFGKKFTDAYNVIKGM